MCEHPEFSSLPGSWLLHWSPRGSPTRLEGPDAQARSLGPSPGWVLPPHPLPRPHGSPPIPALAAVRGLADPVSSMALGLEEKSQVWQGRTWGPVSFQASGRSFSRVDAPSRSNLCPPALCCFLQHPQLARGQLLRPPRTQPHCPAFPFPSVLPSCCQQHEHSLPVCWVLGIPSE